MKCPNCDGRGCAEFATSGNQVTKCLVCDGSGEVHPQRPKVEEFIEALTRLVEAIDSKDFQEISLNILDAAEDARNLLDRLK